MACLVAVQGSHLFAWERHVQLVCSKYQPTVEAGRRGPLAHCRHAPYRTLNRYWITGIARLPLAAALRIDPGTLYGLGHGLEHADCRMAWP